MSAFLGELIGTMILIVFGGGVVGGVVLKKSKAENSGWIVITMGWGLAVAMAAYAVGQFSGAHLNPAVTIGLAAIGSFPWSDVPTYIIAQMIGAFIGAVIVYLHYLPHWKATDDQGAKLAVFSTDPAIKNPAANLLSEVIGTFILLLGFLALGANKFAEGMNPFIVGFLIVAIGLSLGGTTGYAINPARDLGPRIAHFILPIPGKGSSNWGYAWIPVVGPIIGGTYGALFYKWAFEGVSTSTFWIFTIVVAVIVVAALVSNKEQSLNVYKKTKATL
ncbi:MIP/aquaporin family protein [Aeribacillus composti]|uniref:MIP/aquaporin family protein n=1 Tax=Aeribacillus composti TaxID=1868734 RepID=A0ABY9W8T4_9BACI|nr:MIP/aquaporin family protein [Aeribacillus composti]WNF32540.1 MIP/aquaporin family protein [Aeribacillus composti]